MKHRARQKGVALLTVLLLVAVMAVVAVAILDDVRFSVRRTTNAETQAQAQWYAAGAESLARIQIADLVKIDPARTPLEPRWNGRVLEFPVEEGAIRAVVTDGQACFNLNSLVEGVGEDLMARPLGTAQFLALGGREFVVAARGLGASDTRIVLRQILPNALPPIVVAGSLQIPSSILSEASLRFLGLSDPNSVSWGGMLNQAQNFLQQAWWMPFFPGTAIFLTVLSFNLAGEALNEVLNPRRQP